MTPEEYCIGCMLLEDVKKQIHGSAPVAINIEAQVVSFPTLPIAQIGNTLVALGGSVSIVSLHIAPQQFLSERVGKILDAGSRLVSLGIVFFVTPSHITSVRLTLHQQDYLNQ